MANINLIIKGLLIFSIVGFLLIQFTWIGSAVNLVGKTNEVKQFCNEKGYTDFDYSGKSVKYVDGSNGRVYEFACINKELEQVNQSGEWKQVTLEETDVISIDWSPFKGFDYVDFLNWELRTKKVQER